MESWKLKKGYPYHLVIVCFCALVAAAAIGCGASDNKIGKIEIKSPGEIPLGKPVQLTLELHPPMPDPASLRFKWSAEKGKIHPDTVDGVATRQYIPPEKPGQDVITVKILQGETYLDSQNLVITVKGQGTGTDPITVASPEVQVSPTVQVTQTTGAESPSFVEVNKLFFPSGWMGDGQAGRQQVQVDSAWQVNPHSAPTCYKWTYRPGSKGWVAIAWQYPEGNWGKQPGRNFTGQGFTKVSFWVRGEKGGEQLTFKAGGHTDPSLKHQATFEADTTLTLSREWQRGEIKLPANVDLSNVVCGFVWAAMKEENPTGVVFYLDDIRYEK